MYSTWIEKEKKREQGKCSSRDILLLKVSQRLVTKLFEWEGSFEDGKCHLGAGVFIVLVVLMNHNHPVVALIPLPHVSSVAATIAAIHM